MSEGALELTFEVTLGNGHVMCVNLNCEADDMLYARKVQREILALAAEPIPQDEVGFFLAFADPPTFDEVGAASWAGHELRGQAK